MGLEPKSSVSPDASDQLLVHLVIAEGSEAAFRVVYERHAPRVYRVLLRMLGTESDADDAVQETWLRASDRLAAFEWRSALSTWLIAIAVNVARDVLDRRGRWMDVELEEQMIAVESATPDVPMDIERAIALLPAGCRAVFILHDIEGYTHEEIAGQLGYTDGTSKSQLFRARRALRRLLNEAEVEETRHER